MNKIIFADNKREVKVNSPNKSLKSFYQNRNKVLIIRDSGGLGDILMMRMIFEDFKRTMPEAHITFAIPNNYHKAVYWHPFIDEVVDSKTVNENDYGYSINLTTICVRYEMTIRPKADRHRAEIWSNYCGVQLTKSDMHLHIPKILSGYANNLLKENLGDRKKGYVCFCPTSAMISKDLDENQIKGVLKFLRDSDYVPFSLHYATVPGIDCPTFNIPHDEWLALINAADYVISVDSAAVHAASGLNKPTVAIFSWACGKTYMKYHKNCVLVQRHRDDTPNWSCGPCYAHPECPKTSSPRKPCISEITVEEICRAFKKLTSDKDRTHQSSLMTLNNCQTDGTANLNNQKTERRILEFQVL
jgi:ADP-heptose:LPS heptosyltransferase